MAVSDPRFENCLNTYRVMVELLLDSSSTERMRLRLLDTFAQLKSDRHRKILVADAASLYVYCDPSACDLRTSCTSVPITIISHPH